MFPVFGQQAALLPAFEDDLDLFPDATYYMIQVRVEVDQARGEGYLSGWSQIHFTNTTGEEIDELVLMLWPNNAQYQGSMSAGPVYTRGSLIMPVLDETGLALRVPLNEPLQRGEGIELSLPFRVTAGSFTPQEPRRFGLAGEVLIAPTFYPLIPLFAEGEWQTADAPPGGDTTNSEIAFYQIEVSAPAELEVAASGVEVAREDRNGEQVVTYVSGPVRDVALAVGPFERLTEQAGDTVLNMWLLDEHVSDGAVLERAAALQMELLRNRVGPYPYAELDIVDAPGAFGGIEYPGLIYIGTLGSTWIVEPTVHEVAHQWFYGLVGNDQIAEPWLDEALATYAEALYYENAFDRGRAIGFLSNLRSYLRITDAPDLPIGLGVGEYPSEEVYAQFVYLKGALFLETLRGEMGDRAFFAFLGDYFDAFRYRSATARDFQRTAELACDCDLESVFDLWVHEGGPIPGLSE